MHDLFSVFTAGGTCTLRTIAVQIVATGITKLGLLLFVCKTPLGEPTTQRRSFPLTRA